jgi:hypothetical protein
MSTETIDNGQYFYRTAIFTRKEGKVAMVDIDDPTNETALEDWLGIVVSLADGAHTIDELISYMRQQYPNPPANLEETVHSVIERLEEGKIIQLSSRAVTLPYYLASPIEKLNIKKAQKLIKEDGYLSAVH